MGRPIFKGLGQLIFSDRILTFFAKKVNIWEDGGTMIYFILGSHPDLSLAEIKAVLGSEFKPVFRSETVLLNSDVSMDISDLQERLAGTIKIGRIIEELKEWNKENAVQSIATRASEATGKNKISYGLSVYNLDDSKGTKALEQTLDAVGLGIKKILKALERPVRYVKGKEPRLSSAIVETNGLLTSGGEFVFFVSTRGTYIGQTQSIQNFKAWSDRDYGRPRRDAKAGMLPPKLARMMINLGGIDPQGKTILDPFCGSGTVLMEAALMGATELIGSDISGKATADTATNMHWLADHFSYAPPQQSLYTIPAEELPSLSPPPADLLVTEVFLGDPRTRTIDTQEGQRLEHELLPIFEDSFNALKTLLKPSARVVVAFPAFKHKDGTWYRLPMKSLLTNLGYIPEQNFLYFRDNQFVARDIYVLTLK